LLTIIHALLPPKTKAEQKKLEGLNDAHW
jgi:hypothetical protein